MLACRVTMATMVYRGPPGCRVLLPPMAISELEVCRVHLVLRERPVLLARRAPWVWLECGDARGLRATAVRWVWQGHRELRGMPVPPVFLELLVPLEPTARRDPRACGVFAARLAPRAWVGLVRRARRDSRV